MKTIFPVLAAVSLAATVSAFALPEYETLEQALPVAREQHRSILLDLTGRDWCPACIHLKGKILDSDVLNNAVGDRYAVVEVDYPRDPEKIKALGEEECRARQDILKLYQVRGLPCVIVLDEAGLPYAILPTVTKTPEEYLPLLAETARVREARDAALAEATQKEGIERARALVAALELLPYACRSQYKDVLAQIRELDPQNTLGYTDLEATEARRLAQLNAWEEHVKKFFAGVEGSPTSPENIVKGREMGEEYLAQEGLIPELRQSIVLFISESYALQRDIPMVYACLHRAVAEAPHSHKAEQIRRNIKYYDEQLLPDMKLVEKAKEAARTWLPKE